MIISKEFRGRVIDSVSDEWVLFRLSHLMDLMDNSLKDLDSYNDLNIDEQSVISNELLDSIME